MTTRSCRRCKGVAQKRSLCSCGLVGMELHEFGGTAAVNAWVRVALSALPETEQYALVGRLIDTLAENFDVEFGDDTIH